MGNAGAVKRGASTGPRSGERGVTPYYGLLRSDHRGFNGAALRRARSGFEKSWRKSRRNMLQRGRAPESAEWRLPLRLSAPLSRASTGPRSGERGVSPKKPFSSDDSKLQRGRAPESAEWRDDRD